jgi:hypothetical protein
MDVLAYIGLVAIALLCIRIAWTPFEMWKDRVMEASKLNDELSKPERIRSKKLMKIQAEARAELAGKVARIGWYAAQPAFSGTDGSNKMFEEIGEALGLCGRANCCRTFDEALIWFTEEVLGFIKTPHEGVTDITSISNPANACISYLHDEITAEELRSQLPEDIAARILP